MQVTSKVSFAVLVILLTCIDQNWTAVNGGYGALATGHHRSRVTSVWYATRHWNHNSYKPLKKVSGSKRRTKSQDTKYAQRKEHSQRIRYVIKDNHVDIDKKLYTQELSRRVTELMIGKKCLNVNVSTPDRPYQDKTWKSWAKESGLGDAIHKTMFIKKDGGRIKDNKNHPSSSRGLFLRKRSTHMRNDNDYNWPSKDHPLNGREVSWVKSAHLSQLANMYQSTSSPQYCPAECLCRTTPGDQNQHQAGTVVDCSDRRLTKIPDLPSAAVEVLLQNNLIEDIPCGSFNHLKRLSVLDVSGNQQLKPFSSCAFNITGPLATLNLSNTSLGDAHLPGDVFDNLHLLANLDLSKNNLSDIKPSLFKRLDKLQQLNLYNNKIMRINNDTFMYLPSLLFLSLQRNLLRYKPETFEPRAFSGLFSLHTLHLQGNEPGSSEVVYPDKALSLLPWLRELKLDGYAQQPFGQGFAQISNLTHLSLGSTYSSDENAYCQMSLIPKDMFSNVTSRNPLHLNMSGCGLDDIHPDVFSWLPTLYLLDLSNNRNLGFYGFEKLSQGLANSTLEILNLTRICHHLQSEPNIINDTNFKYLKYTPLKILLLEKNDLFDARPQAIMDLPQTLEYLSFYDNVFQRLDSSSGLLQLINLKTLILSRQNHFTNVLVSDLESVMAQTNRSKRLLTTSQSFLTPDDQNFKGVNSTLINFPQVTRGPTLIADLPPVNPDFMKQIQEGYDYCKQFEDKSIQQQSQIVFFPLPMRLEYLYLNDMGLKYDVPVIFVLNNMVLKHFEFKENYINCFSGPFIGMPSLEFADFSNNDCLHLNPAAFKNLSSVKKLLLQHNVLGDSLAKDVSGATFSGLTNLETLDLSNNAIKTLSPAAFVNNLRLQTLNLSHNSLQQFAPHLLNTFELLRLDLSANSLEALSEQTCNELAAIKSESTDFNVLIGNNSFVCGCDSIGFLYFLVEHPGIFSDINSFSCHLTNGSYLTHDLLEGVLPDLEIQCVGSSIFTVVLGAFLVLLGCLAALSLYFHKRWQWSYLFHVGRSRLHIGSTVMNYMTAAQVFLTYDQDDVACRHLVRKEVIPRLRQAGISYVLGETDFGAGPLGQSIAGAVTCTRKTLVLLSRGIFEDHHRELEVNLAIMHELHMRIPVLVPVLLLTSNMDIELDLVTERQRGREGDAPVVEIAQRSPLNPRESPANRGCRSRQNRYPEDHEDAYLEEITNLVENFPPDISAFLSGQSQRCLLYESSSPTFWSELIWALQSHDY